LELSHLHYNTRHKPGIYNVAPNVLSRACALAPVLSVSCTNRSVILATVDCTTSGTLFDSGAYLTPTRRRSCLSIIPISSWN